MSIENWLPWIAECRKQELPVVPTSTEPWFSAVFVASNFLCIERSDRFIREWKSLGLPMIRIKNHPLIKLSDVERYGLEQSAEDQERDIPAPIPEPEPIPVRQPRKSKKN